MIKKSQIKLNKFLNKYKVSSSAPMRVDLGNVWDLPLLSITHKKNQPITVNIAINYRVTVELFPFSKGVCIEFNHSGKDIYCTKYYPFSSIKHSVILAVLSYFNVTNLYIKITSDIPSKLGFGGSASMLIALISAISGLLSKLKIKKSLSINDIVLLAYNIERIFIETGIQDHLVAAYGGVNQWNLSFDTFNMPYKRTVLIDKESYQKIESRILIAYSNELHDSNLVLQKSICAFCNSSERQKWIKINNLSHLFSKSLRRLDWFNSINYMNKELDLRVGMEPKILTETTAELISVARNTNCAARFTGAGYGGGVWALGNKKNISILKELWGCYQTNNNSVVILDSKISHSGVLVDIESI